MVLRYVYFVIYNVIFLFFIRNAVNILQITRREDHLDFIRISFGFHGLYLAEACPGFTGL